MQNITMLLLLFLLTSCTHQLLTSNKAKLKLYVFDCGTVNISDISIFSPGYDKGKHFQLKGTCYLIDHPKGKMIWDTGLPDALVHKKNGHKNGVFHMFVKKTLKGQLGEIGIDPSDVDYIALSHFHFDHSGNANLFKDSKLLIQKEEFEAIYSEDPTKYRFAPQSYNELSKETAIVLSGDYDVFKDGTVRIIKSSGHTPGHQVLMLDLQNEGKIILSGDLYHFKKNRRYKRVPSFNFNFKDSKKAMDKVENILKKEKAKLWIQHDPVQFKQFKLSPNYYN